MAPARPTEVVQLTSATGSAEEADALAEALLEARLAACVQVLGPVRSRYRWRGRLESASEWLCVARTTAGRAEAAVAAVRAAHSYDVPEIVVTPVIGGHGPYLRWVAEETTPAGPAGPASPTPQGDP